MAFAGFAGLVSVLGTSRLPPDVRLWRVRVLIVTSLSALFGALAPSIVAQLGLEPEQLWRACALLLALVMFGQISFVYYWMPASRGTGPFRLVATPSGVVLTCAAGLAISSLVLVAAGLLSGIGAAVYSLALLFLLAAGSFHFLALILAAQPET